jgi:hypothetical protein
VLVDAKRRAERDEFKTKVKDEWSRMWTERFDDRVRAEGVVVRDYPLLFMNQGSVIFASRDAKTPSFSDIVTYWASTGSVYSPEPAVGGWGKFIRTELKKTAQPRAREFRDWIPDGAPVKQQLRKGGRGWLHV